MTISSVRELIHSLREELRERREARTTYLALQRELGSFRSAREVDDLLGTIQNEDSPEAQQVRDLLLDNLRPTPELYRVS